MSSVAIAKSLQRALALVFAAFALISAAPALAQSEPEHVRLELVSQGEVVPGQEAYVALRQVIDKDWHTYWRNSGDSGEATKIAWTLPEGWKAGDIVWKTPERLSYMGLLVNYGYSDEVILPVPISVPANAQPGATVPIKAQVSYLVCKDLCIPGSAQLSLDLKVAGAGAPAADPKWSPVIADALAKAPKPAGLVATTELAGGVLKLSVTGDPVKGGDFPRAYFFPFSGAAIDHAKPQAIEKGPDGLTLTMTPSPTWKGGPLAGVLTLGDAAFEVDAAVGAPLAGAVGGGTLAAAPLEGEGGPAGGGLSLPLAALFAFLGGLILNLMPCVFPVLSMKAASLAAHAHEARAARAQGIAFLAGVLVTFLTLAALLLAARAAGEAVGWGFQLQSPPVTAGLAILMLLVALNLSGLFEIGTSVQGAGSGLASKSGLAGAFFTGVLAVVVAAPCTAPFMAGALGYAVSQPPAIALAVFAALGLGFAAPFTALAFAPGILRRLPRPGPWMEVFKTVLSFPMYGAAAWLAWVFAAQAGQSALGLLLAAAISIAFAAWLFGRGQRASSTGWRLGLQLALPLVLVASVFALAPVVKPQAAAESAAAAAAEPGNIPQEPWDAARIPALQAEGKVVFVDFTADWCVTCKVNEGTALKSKSVADAFAAADAVFMVADWTLRDARIAAALAEHGRTGVPLYLMYPKGGGAPEVLPQLLTEGLVKKALQKAAG